MPLYPTKMLPPELLRLAESLGAGSQVSLETNRPTAGYTVDGVEPHGFKLASGATVAAQSAGGAFNELVRREFSLGATGVVAYFHGYTRPLVFIVTGGPVALPEIEKVSPVEAWLTAAYAKSTSAGRKRVAEDFGAEFVSAVQGLCVKAGLMKANKAGAVSVTDKGRALAATVKGEYYSPNPAIVDAITAFRNAGVEGLLVLRDEQLEAA